MALFPEHGEDVSSFETQDIGGRPVIRTKANGDCIYLSEAHGCSIYERRPLMCRVFDCADLVASMGPAAVPRLDDDPVVAAGFERLSRQQKRQFERRGRANVEAR